MSIVMPPLQQQGQLGSPRRIDVLFEERSAATPSDTALTVHSPQQLSPSVAVTYEQLNKRSAQLAARLRGVGIGEGDVVAVCSRRTVGAVVALLGVCKTGAAFLPLSPDDPPVRVAQTMTLAQAQALVIVRPQWEVSPQRELDWPWHDGNVRSAVVHLDASGETVAVSTGYGRQQMPTMALEPSTLYVLFTSGSTGAPHGVAGTHVGVINRCIWAQKEYPWTSADVCGARTPFTFVDSIAEIFGPLIFAPPGCTLHLLPDRADGVSLRRWVACLGITRLLVVPALLDSFIDALADAPDDGNSLQVISVSGEQLSGCSAQRTRELLPRCLLLNLYGSTEVSGDVTCCNVSLLPLECDSSLRVPIGLPIDNCQVLLMDAAGQRITAAGVVGEVVVAGPHVAHGYIYDTVRTAEQFVHFEGIDGTVFRTGDYAKLRADGQFVWLGRADRQVQVRGQRIQLEEVEMAILNLRMEQVDEAAAMLDQSGNLCAFVSSVGGVAEASLRKHCIEQLPSHMVPVRFRLVSRLPKTSSGKLDRQAMLAMLSSHALVIGDGNAMHSTAESQSSSSHVGDPASTQVVDAVSEVWREVLVLSTQPKCSDSWFELGGTSLSAVAMLERVSVAVTSLLGRTLQLRFIDLVANPTLGGICASFTTGDVSILPGSQPRKRARIDHERKELARAGDGHAIRERLKIDATAGWLLAAGKTEHATCVTTEAGPVWSIVTWDGHAPHIEDSSTCSRCDMHTRWRYNARACVDAAPAWLMVGDDSTAGVAVIASHGGVVAAVSVTSGRECWSRQLEGRVDASVSVCLGDAVAGTVLACVGSYNGTIYFIRTEDGSIAWEYPTGSEVRCMGCVEYGEHGIIWCGSHDHCVYALSVQQRQCLFKLQCRGSIMSAPVCVRASEIPHRNSEVDVQTNEHLVFVASQDGLLRALERAADDEPARPRYRHVWEYSVGSPVFAGLVATCELVIVCDVTGCVHGVAVATGKLLWQYRCVGDGKQGDGIFVTPSLLSDDEVVVSLRSGRLQSLSATDGRSLWSMTVATGALTALGLDPARKLCQSGASMFGCVAAADGSVSVLLFTPGSCVPPMLISRIVLPASVFCAPLMCGRRVLVGCRDDALYCLELDTAIGAEGLAA